MGRHGENIRLRADGRWESRVLMKQADSSKVFYKYLYGATYQEVRQKRAEFMTNHPDRLELPATALPSACQRAEPLRNARFQDAALEWMKSKQTTVKESTYAYYINQVEKHLLPHLADLPIQEMDEALLEKFLAEKQNRGGLQNGGALSVKTVLDLKKILMQILNYAKKNGMVDEVPNCPYVPGAVPLIRVMTKSEQEDLVLWAKQEDTPFSLGVLISLFAGLRIGEVCALQWRDFNFSSGTVSVNRTVMRIYNAGNGMDVKTKTKVMIDTPKTACALRTIPLSDEVLRYFRQRYNGIGSECMVTGDSRFMEPRVCLIRFKRLLRRAGIQDYNFHVLRHTFATRCVESGMDAKSLSEIMGHSTVALTMQRYVHPSMEQKREQMNRMMEIPLHRTQKIQGQDSGSDKECKAGNNR